MYNMSYVYKSTILYNSIAVPKPFRRLSTEKSIPRFKFFSLRRVLKGSFCELLVITYKQDLSGKPTMKTMFFYFTSNNRYFYLLWMDLNYLCMTEKIYYCVNHPSALPYE